MSHLSLLENNYRRKHLTCVRHITLDPTGPGVVRIHMIPPHSQSPEDPFLLLLNGAVMLLSLLLCARMGHTLMWIILKGITCAAVTALLYTLALGRTAEYRWMLEKGRSFLRKWRKKA